MEYVNISLEHYQDFLKKAFAFDLIKKSIEKNGEAGRVSYSGFPGVDDDLVRLLTDTNHKVPAEQDELANE